jgi:hypothetical protein
MPSKSAEKSVHPVWIALVCLVLAGLAPAAAPGTKTITLQDLMKFRAIQTPTLSDNGTAVAYALQPDRGDGEAVVHALSTGKTIRVPRGGQPAISKNSRWAAMPVKIAFAGSGYAIFLPDVVFEVGHPGMSMVKCLVPSGTAAPRVEV